MPAKRTYNVRANRDFLVVAGLSFFFCLWAIKDAWYPSPGVLKKHPLEVAGSFDAAGAVGQLHVAVGDSVHEGQLLAELLRSKMNMEYETAKKSYSASKNKHTLMEEALRNAEKNGAGDEAVAELKDGVLQAQLEMDAALATAGDARTALDATELRASTKGVVKEILAVTHSYVEANETVLVIDPKDHFYLFNKSLAIVCFIGFWIFLGLYILAR
jgi:multidrug resistance efflux pump